ncbi:hypothetical protein EDB86DRAFT_2889836, partial [Lactarius hatsudake]
LNPCQNATLICLNFQSFWTMIPNMPGSNWSSTRERALRVVTQESFIEELRSHLDTVKFHYLFDQRDAETHYISRRQKSDKASLQARYRWSWPRFVKTL